jgi:hypothetical protein
MIGQHLGDVKRKSILLHSIGKEGIPGVFADFRAKLLRFLAFGTACRVVIYVAEFPHRFQHSCQFVGENLDGFAFFPPTFGVELPIASAGDAYRDAGRQDFLVDVARAACVVVGSNHDNVLPVVIGGKLGNSLRFIDRIVRILIEGQNRFFWDASLHEVVLDEFRKAGIGS